MNVQPVHKGGAPSTISRYQRGFFAELKYNRYLYLLTLPGILFFLIFNYLPMVGLYFAFVDYSPMAFGFGLASKFVGLTNFRFFFTSNDWIRVTFNTLFLNALFISTGLFMQITLAVALNELTARRFKKVAQTFMFLPNFLSWTVISVFSIALFATDGGFVNNCLALLNIPPINFYQNADVWPGLLVFLRIWKGAGFGTVIYLATITGIDPGIYEAATIDGASRFGRIRYVTLPLLKTTTIMLMILAVGGIFYGDFGMIYALIGDNPMLRPTTDVIDTFVYRALRMNNDIGMSAAVGLFQSAVGFVLVISTNFITKRMDADSALF